ncbi:unnamed protein product [Paramecium primaurelia]|uniref:CSC1/OSCA1-like cytosolic domain-containing protein n=1 Tax=Paramecium primaurelia TaxID=5886 RepID=A0A8S1MF58_PARPR|nr:unnamed protein product [Paramecium primaurelia]
MNYPKFIGETLEFDPLQKPPKLQYALQHQLATSCGQNIKNSDYCQCCGLGIDKMPLPLNIEIINLAFLGQGVPLYFNLMLLIILLHFVLFFIFTVPNVSQNYIANNCIAPTNYAYKLWKQNGCEQNCPLKHDAYQYFENLFSDCKNICQHYSDVCIQSQTSRISFVNKQLEDESKLIQSSLILCSVIIYKILMVLIREKQRKIEYAIDKELLSPSDFTAILNNLPKNDYNEKELKIALEEYCKEFDPKNKYEVVKINIAYDIVQFVDKGRQKLKLEKQLENTSYGNKEKLLKQIKEISNQQQVIEAEIENGSYKKTTPIAFITFQTKKQLQNLLEQTKLSYWEAFMIALKSIIKKKDRRGFYFKHNYIQISRAPEPDDVFWENCGTDENTQLKRRILSWFVIVFLLGLSLGTLYGLNVFQNHFLLNSDNKQFLMKTMASLSKSLIITIVDGLIYYFITLLANQERHVTKTQQDTSVAEKLSYVQFINSCLLVIIINVIGTYYEYSKQDAKLFNFAVQQQGGIVDDILYVSGANALLVPLSAYFNIFYIIKKFKQMRIEKNTHLNQIEANKLFEGPQVQFYDQYSYLCKTTWLTLFFAPLIPISILFGLIGLILYYWIQKYLLLRRNRKPPFQSSHLDREMLNLLDLSPLLLSTMQFLIDYSFHSSQLCQTINVASLAVSGLELIIPSCRIHRILYKDVYEEEEQVRYEEIYLKLPTDYDRTNPLTQQVAMQEFVKNKLKKNSGPLLIELSQNLNVNKPKRNQALQDLIYKGICDPKKIRMKILKQKLQLIVKMRQIRNLKHPIVLERQIQQNQIAFDKYESKQSSELNSPTYLKTPEYNFSSIINIQPQLLPQQQQIEMLDMNSTASQNKSAYLDTPKYYFNSKNNLLFKSIKKCKHSQV